MTPPTIIYPPAPVRTRPGFPHFAGSRLPLHFHASANGETLHSQPWQDLPKPTGLPPFHLALDSVLADDAMAQIKAAHTLVFHAVGDTGGVNETIDVENVAAHMEADFSATSPVSRPAFCFHLGDVVYYEGQAKNYFAQFYEPYWHYPAPIFAIPGNHDGDVDPTTGESSLEAFVRNFCAPAPIHTHEAKDAPRDALTQPNVYWTLQAPFLTLIGLYSNCPEGGQLRPDQIAWLESELRGAPADQALLIAVHHPIYSAYGPHPGSTHLKQVLESACAKAGRIPDAVLSGHVHNYQRFSGELCGQTVPFFVAGAGGYNHRLHELSPEIHGAKLPISMPGSVGTLENFCDQRHGYLRIAVTPPRLSFTYLTVPNNPGVALEKTAEPFDTLTIQLGQHRR